MNNPTTPTPPPPAVVTSPATPSPQALAAAKEIIIAFMQPVEYEFALDKAMAEIIERHMQTAATVEATEASGQEKQATVTIEDACEATRQVTCRWWIEKIVKCHGEAARADVEDDPLMMLYGLCDTPLQQELQAELLREREETNKRTPPPASGQEKQESFRFAVGQQVRAPDNPFVWKVDDRKETEDGNEYTLRGGETLWWFRAKEAELEAV